LTPPRGQDGRPTPPVLYSSRRGASTAGLPKLQGPRAQGYAVDKVCRLGHRRRRRRIAMDGGLRGVTRPDQTVRVGGRDRRHLPTGAARRRAGRVVVALAVLALTGGAAAPAARADDPLETAPTTIEGVQFQ